MIWLESSTSGSAKHPSTMFWKFGNQIKKFKGWDKESWQKVEFDPVGKEWAVVWIGRSFSGWSTEADKAIYSTEVPYSELSKREIQIYYFDNDRKNTIFKGVYNREQDKEMLKGKGANLFLNIHVVCGEGWEAHIETLQVKGLNCITVMEALRNWDYDNKTFKINALENKKYKVISYEEIQCGEGRELTDKEKEDLQRLCEELQSYYNAHNDTPNNTNNVSTIDEQAQNELVAEVEKKQTEAIAKGKKKKEEVEDDYDLPF